MTEGAIEEKERRDCDIPDNKGAKAGAHDASTGTPEGAQFILPDTCMKPKLDQNEMPQKPNNPEFVSSDVSVGEATSAAPTNTGAQPKNPNAIG